MQTAIRELYEETGAITAEITEVGVYKLTDYGLLCFADVSELGSIPADSEIAQVKTFPSLPNNLTYGQIHGQLFHWVQLWLSERY
jgi:8-oxo-dGTP pyrophosphatase MutT (NUDIX family)